MSTTTQATIVPVQSSTITSYNKATKVATLSQPVDLSLGYNQVVGDVTSTYNIIGTDYNMAQAVSSGTSLPGLSTDEQGNFSAIFNLPGSTFQTGSRVFRIDNRKVETDPTTATTYAEATFTATGLQVNASGADFSPSVDSSASSFTATTTISNQSITTNTTAAYTPFDPVAQTFILSKDAYPNGAFLSSVKLFFQGKPSTNIPITVSLVNTLNGVPNGSTLDYSTVKLFPSQVNVSQNPQFLDSTTSTTFTFNAPVYVQSGVLYAILINTQSADYTLYYAQQNSTAIPSTAKANPTDANPANPTKIGQAPYVGGLFESQNSITWSVDQTKDLMFVIDQCVFNTNVESIIPFVVPTGAPFRKMGTNDVRHKLLPDQVSQVIGNYSAPTEIDAFSVSTTQFVPTDTSATYQYQATIANGFGITSPQNITPGNYGTPTYTNVALNDGQGPRVILPASSNSFTLTATLASSDPNVSPVVSDDGVSLYTIAYAINNMGITNTVIQLTASGNGYSSSAYANISNPDLAGGIPATVGMNIDANGNVISVYTQTTGSGYLKTPTITITDPVATRTSSNANASVIVSGETSASGGNAYAKYFTKPVILQPGNDSGDLRVYYTAYQPVGTAIYVYYKILSSQDTSPFASQNWQLMTPTTNLNTYSTQVGQLIEYECAPGIFGSGAANNSISYLSTNGTTYTNFIQFAIKVVMASNDNTNIPFLTDIRAIALPPGTGI
jgi:hypothetical protein